MRAVRLIVPLLVVVLLVLAGWLAWQAWQVNKDLSAAVDDAHQLRAAVQGAGDQSDIDQSLADLQEHSSSAADRTDGFSWSLLTHVPVVGDDARGVRLVSDVVSDLSNDGLGPLVQSVSDLDSILPKDGQVSLQAVRGLQTPVAQASEALQKADQELAAQDSSGFVQRFQDKYLDLADQVSEAADAMGAADTAVKILPAMLGDGDQRQYLLVFQNNAEIRATGGLPGAVSVVEAEDGKVELTHQVAAGSFGMRATPVLPLTESEVDLYGKQLGTYFVDANFTPDFPRTADLMRARWEEEYPERIDGVLSVDPVAVSYLLAATGPIQVGDVSLTADNVVDELLHGVYLRYADPDDQDEFFRQVARAAFDKVSAGAAAPRTVLSALAQGVDEGRIYVHSFADADQSALAGTRIAGEFQTEATSTPQINVTLNDTTGAKMSYYLRYGVEATSDSCEDGVQTISAHAVLASKAPEDAASLPDYITGGGHFGVKPGYQLVTVRMFGPADGTITAFAIDDRKFKPEGIDVDGRPVATAYAYLKPGQSADVTWSMETGKGQTGDTDVTVTPSVEAGTSSSLVPSSCS